jgi:hypothetical protein
MIAKAHIRRLQEWMGRADITTTTRYLHYAPPSRVAELVAEAFRVEHLDVYPSRGEWPPNMVRAGRRSR